MTDHDSDPYSDLADYIEGAPAAAPVVAPHPALAGSPQWLGEDDGESEGTPPDDAASISLEVIAVCAREPQNDTGNGQRLLHHFGQDLLNVRDVGWHAWTGTHWEREGGQEIAVRRAQATATRIVLEADFLAHTPHEAALIEAADDTAAALAAIDKVKELTDEQKARKRDLQQAVDAGAWARAQLQARQIARRFNNAYGDVFPVPEPYVMGGALVHRGLAEVTGSAKPFLDVRYAAPLFQDGFE